MSERERFAAVQAWDRDPRDRGASSVWCLVYRPGDSNDEYVIAESPRGSIISVMLDDLRKAIRLGVGSVWRSQLQKGLDMEFKLWGYAERPTRAEVMQERRTRAAKQRSPRSGA